MDLRINSVEVLDETHLLVDATIIKSVSSIVVTINLNENASIMEI